MSVNEQELASILQNLGSLSIVPRNEWDALPPKERQRLDVPVPKVLISHTQTEKCTSKADCITLMQEMQRAHMDEGLPDIKFNFVVGGDGLIYEGRGWEFSPWKQPTFPELHGLSLEISHAGNNVSDTRQREVFSRLQLIYYGETEGYLSQNVDTVFETPNP